MSRTWSLAGKRSSLESGDSGIGGSSGEAKKLRDDMGKKADQHKERFTPQAVEKLLPILVKLTLNNSWKIKEHESVLFHTILIEKVSAPAQAMLAVGREYAKKAEESS